MAQKLHFSTSFHPQTDGQTEVVNRCLETYLRCFSSHKPQEWCKWLPWALFWYNYTWHNSTKITPYQALYGRLPPSITAYIPKTARLQVVEEQPLQNNLTMAQERMKKFADKHRTERAFCEGTWCFPGFSLYYKILQKVGKVSYKLELPHEARIHLVFHVSQLKRKLGQSVQMELQVPTDSVEIIRETEAIIERRMVNKEGTSAIEVLV